MLGALVTAVDRPAARGALIGAFLVGGIAVAAIFPPTPDEVARIADVHRALDRGPYPYFWPIGNILLIALNPLFHAGILSDLHAVRIFNFLLAALPVALLIGACRRPALLLVLPALMPYAYLVMSTAAQQGLMLPLLLLIVRAALPLRPAALMLAALGLYLVNPGMIAVLPTALLALAALGRAPPRAALLALGAYLPMAASAALVWAQTGDVMPTLSSNGPLNLWLGNNPHPLAHRGVGEGPGDAGFAASVMDYLRSDPAGFLANLGTKLALFWAPWDHLRSGMGDGLQTLVFVYVGFAQVLIYATVLRVSRHVDRDRLLLALAICIGAWLLYTGFFVKIRFRVPFDLLLFLTCMLPERVRTREGSLEAPRALSRAAG